MSTATDEFPRLTHGNYHAWAPRMTAELQRLGVWRFCTGDESIPAAKPTATSPPGNATIAEKAALERNFADATRSYNDACRRNDQAVGLIMTKIEPSQYADLEDKSAKEVWDALKTRHANTHTGVAAFFYESRNARKEVHRRRRHEHAPHVFYYGEPKTGKESL